MSLQTLGDLHGQLTLQRGAFRLDTGEFTIPLTGLTAIFGRSGSGKTTLLRCLAGFEPEAQGSVYFNHQAWLFQNKSLPVHKRQLGYVFQEASLFAHLNVEGNLRYGQQRAKQARGIDFDQVVAWLDLSHLLTRSSMTLSGGERQRVAIGRTLLSQPNILMMDEPMASLDLFAKRAIMPYLERLRDELDIPILLISHSPEEVARLADFVLFMDSGKITHFEAIEQALNRADTPLYQGSEPRAVLSVKVVSHSISDGLSLVQAGDAPIWVPAVEQAVGDSLRLVISAQQVSLLAKVPEHTSVLNYLPVTIQALEPINEYSVLVRLRVANEPWPLLAQVTKRSQKALKLAVGQHWIAAIKSASILN